MPNCTNPNETDRRAFLSYEDQILQNSHWMKQSFSSKHTRPAATPTPPAGGEPSVTEHIRRLVYISCQSRGGPEHMTLNDWRELELELKTKLDNERSKAKRESQSPAALLERRLGRHRESPSEPEKPCSRRNV
jgi:hypothetical protein